MHEGQRLHTLGAGGISVTIDLAVGHLRAVEIVQGARRVTPFYTAPWVDDPDIAGDESIPPNLRFLSGDFFCAPFGQADIEPAPSHGWPANSEWEHLESRSLPGGSSARFALRKPVMGARLVKEITLRDRHPFVYQRHVFEGGDGAVSVASHAMTQFRPSGRLSFSPKAYGDVPTIPQESDPARGRSALAYPSRFTDFGLVPLKDGGSTDIRAYPIAERHEDFLMLVEAPASRLGWAAAVRHGIGDVVLSLKSPSHFPVTFLWFSNGGRDYRPWNGRNVGVLGIEEGRAYSAYGHKASAAPNPLAESGVPTALQLRPGATAEVRHVIGGIPLPEGWTEIATVDVDQNALTITDVDGDSRTLPFDSGFLPR